MYQVKFSVKDLDGFSFSIQEMDKVLRPDATGNDDNPVDEYFVKYYDLVDRLGIGKVWSDKPPILGETYVDNHGGHGEFERIACNARLEVGVRVFETTPDGDDEDVYVAPIDAVLAKLGFCIDAAAFLMAAYEVGKENSANIQLGFDIDPSEYEVGKESSRDLRSRGGVYQPRPSIVIKHNNTTVTAPCGVCDKPHRPEIGRELFLEGTQVPVCFSCGKRYAPELADMAHPS